MDLERLRTEAAGDPANTEVITIRLPGDHKAALLKMCEDEGLALGKTMRLMIADFIKAYEESKQ